MVDSFIFTGSGFVTGQYKISNDEIYKHVKTGYLDGFNEFRVEASDNYKKQKDKNPDLNPFDYMVDLKMGFRTRYHVVPFPPSIPQYKNAENSLDLCVKAIDKALTKSGLSGNNIDAWFIGTATPHQQAPGIAEFAKAYFTDIDNTSQTFSLTSACVGFNINIENAVSYLKSNPKAKHVVVAHSEVMSKLLTHENDFVSFSTFGDSAAAMIVSRVETDVKCGIIDTHNGEDVRMLDFLGANKKGHLYMNPRMVKSRAVPNIANTAKLLLEKASWTLDDLIYFIPHQTGNAIVWSVAEELQLDHKKLYQDVQLKYGNLSGASIPACFCELEKEGKLNPGDKILTSVAGLGGEFGGFTYIVPQKEYKFTSKLELEGKTTLITGSTGGLGSKIAELAAKKGSNLILHYNRNKDAATELKTKLEQKFDINVQMWQADLSKIETITTFHKHLIDNNIKLNYLINTHAITGGLAKATEVSMLEFETVINANYKSIKNLCNTLKSLVSECILITGSVGEDAQFPGSASYVASKRALRGFAVQFATEVYKNRIRCIYYLPGIVDSGMVSKLDKGQIATSMMSVSQKKLINADEIANRMLKSVYRFKIAEVRTSYESNLEVIKDGYLKF